MAQREETGFLKQSLNEAQDKAGDLVARTQAALTGNAQDFVTNAAICDLYEIEAGRIAQARATSEGVREAGGRMVKDHIASSQKLREKTAAGHLTIPASLDSRHAGLIEELRETPADQFDRIWLDQQKAAHKEAVAAMRHYRKEGDDPGLRRFAGEALPIIESHLAHVEMLS